MSSSVARHIRGNIVGYVALFLALSAGAYAATNVAPRNSVDSKSIRNHQVKKADLAQNSVRSATVRNGSLTGADVLANSLTGAQINEGSLGSVPSATSATNATNATDATHATTADSAVHALYANPVIGSPETALATAGPFTISSRCADSGGEPMASLFANGPAGSDMHAFLMTNNNGTFTPVESQKSVSGDTSMIGITGSFGIARTVDGTAFLSTSSGTVVEVDFDVVASASLFSCSFRGTAALAS
jgi:hypothetical protein